MDEAALKEESGRETKRWRGGEVKVERSRWSERV